MYMFSRTLLISRIILYTHLMVFNPNCFNDLKNLKAFMFDHFQWLDTHSFPKEETHIISMVG